MSEPMAVSADSAAATQVLKYYELVDAGDVPALVDLFTPDATYHRPGYQPMVGHQALTHFYTEARVIREGAHTVKAVVAADDRIAVHGEFHGILHDGRRVDLRFADFFDLDRAGRFSRRDTFFFAPLV